MKETLATSVHDGPRLVGVSVWDATVDEAVFVPADRIRDLIRQLRAILEGRSDDQD